MVKDTGHVETDERVEKDKIQANMKRIWELAREGKSVQEIRNVLDLKDEKMVKNALVQLMAEKGENLTIDGLDRASINPTYTGGGIRIDPAMLEGTGFREGDEFDVTVTDDGITLKKRPPL